MVETLMHVLDSGRLAGVYWRGVLLRVWWGVLLDTVMGCQYGHEQPRWGHRNGGRCSRWRMEMRFQERRQAWWGENKRRAGVDVLRCSGDWRLLSSNRNLADVFPLDPSIPIRRYSLLFHDAWHVHVQMNDPPAAISEMMDNAEISTKYCFCNWLRQNKLFLKICYTQKILIIYTEIHYIKL